jgi:hypothetical protein
MGMFENRRLWFAVLILALGAFGASSPVAAQFGAPTPPLGKQYVEAAAGNSIFVFSLP